MYKVKSVTICLLIYFGQHLAAQNKFYIKPTIDHKESTSTYFMPEEKPINNSGYYIFEKQKITRLEGLSPLYLGICVGYHVNKKISIEAGIAQDDAISAFNFYFKRGGDYGYYNSAGYVMDGTAGRKIPVLIHYNLISADSSKNNKKLHSSLDLFLGLSFYRQPKGSSKPLTSTGQDSILVAPDTYMSYTVEGWSNYHKSILYTIGLSSDIRYKKRAICTLSFYFEYGRYKGRGSAILSEQSLDILIEKPSSQIRYREEVYSRGSGFMLQLSRKIYWSDFKKKEKETQMRLF